MPLQVGQDITLDGKPATITALEPSSNSVHTTLHYSRENGMTGEIRFSAVRVAAVVGFALALNRLPVFETTDAITQERS